MSYHCFSEVSKLAQKKHRCIWCWNPILEGSTYIRERSVSDGTFQNHTWHEACRDDADKWFTAQGEGEFVSDNEMPFFALYRLEFDEIAAISKAEGTRP